MFDKVLVAILVTVFTLGLAGSSVASVATVNLGDSGNFVILAKTGISTTGSTSITGDIGLSPAAASYITGFALILPAASAFSTSALITGKVYASDYANRTPANLTTAVLDMQTAYTDTMGRAPSVTELGAGNIGGLTLASGVYKWGTGLIIPTDVTLSGGANEIWIFQIAQNLIVSSAAHVILAGGAQASNIFWVVAGQTTLGTTSVFNGNILDQTAIVLDTGATLNGRALAQTAVTLDSNAVAMPTVAVLPPTPQLTCSNLYWFDNTNTTCQSQKEFCGTYMYLGLQTFNNQQDCSNAVLAQQAAPLAPPASDFGQQFITGYSISDIQTDWLVKSKNSVEVFFVDASHKLHWIINELAAAKHFGSSWNKIIKEFNNLGTAGLLFGNNLE